MKREVDLTENRIFTTPEEPNGDAKIMLDHIKKRKPWDLKNKLIVVLSDADLEIGSKNKECIITGNEKERQERKQNYLYDKGKVCKICGFDSRKKPWAGIVCKCYSSKYKPKIPWIF